SCGSSKVDSPGVFSWSLVASTADARHWLVFRKIHIDARTSHGDTCDSNDDAFGDGSAHVGDEPYVDLESVPPFYDFQGYHRSQGLNGAIFRMSSNTDTVDLTGVSALRRVADFCELTKPRIVLMVLVTAFVGFYIGSEKIPDYLRLLQML